MGSDHTFRLNQRCGIKIFNLQPVLQIQLSDEIFLYGRFLFRVKRAFDLAKLANKVTGPTLSTGSTVRAARFPA